MYTTKRRCLLLKPSPLSSRTPIRDPQVLQAREIPAQGPIGVKEIAKPPKNAQNAYACHPEEPDLAGDEASVIY